MFKSFNPNDPAADWLNWSEDLVSKAAQERFLARMMASKDSNVMRQLAEIEAPLTSVEAAGRKLSTALTNSSENGLPDAVAEALAAVVAGSPSVLLLPLFFD